MSHLIFAVDDSLKTRPVRDALGVQLECRHSLLATDELPAFISSTSGSPIAKDAGRRVYEVRVGCPPYM
jgi:hypothetical protein